MINLGILTYFSSINYGAFLQAYTFQEYLRNNYADILNVEIINFTMKISQDAYLDRIILQNVKYRNQILIQYESFLLARNNLLLSKDKLVSDNIDEVKEYLKARYDIIVVGSDEVWKTDSIRGFPNAYWMNFELEKTAYMAYAVSGRNDYQKLNIKMQQYIKESMGRFVYIGTRDEITRMELLKINEREIYRNCDPVFLMPEIYIKSDKKKQSIKKKYKLNDKKPVISIMISDKYIGYKLYKMLRYDNQVINLYNINEKIEANNLTGLSPFEWSDVIGISDLVITDFFHGVVFSIVHETPFFALERSEKGRGKVENLLLENGMDNSFIYLLDYDEKQKLIRELYTRGRSEMVNCDKTKMKKTKKNEYQKSNSFFNNLSSLIDI